jgi:CheY-like chemotaxis protein
MTYFPPKPPSGTYPARPPRILVVDDEELMRSLLERYLEQRGFQVVAADEGQTALGLFREGSFDLVLSDLRMPGLNGLQLLTAIKEMNRRVPVILVSGHGDAETVVAALKAGAENFLAKPLSIETLGRVVDQALALSCLLPTAIASITKVRQATHLQCPSQPELICDLVQIIALSAVNVGFVAHDLDNNLKLALVEAITNAMEHGHHWNAQLNLTLEAEMSPDRLLVSVEDQGPGFRLDTLPDPTSESHLLSERGRGVFLMRAIMDEVRFNRTGNKVTLVKYKHPGDPKVSAAS